MSVTHEVDEPARLQGTGPNPVEVWNTRKFIEGNILAEELSL